jgi:hypothetical protein
MATVESPAAPKWAAFVEEAPEGQRVRVNYELKWLPRSVLFVDYHEDVLNNGAGEKGRGYQRRQNRIAKRIVKDGLNPDLFGVLIVNQREDGRYSVADGGTRYRTLEMLEVPGDTLVPCLVFGWDEPLEVTNYLKLNQERAQLSQIDIFLAKLKAKDPEALAIEDILRAETEVGVSSSKDGWKAVWAVTGAYRRHNLTETLVLMRELGWLDQPRGKSQAIPVALSRLLEEKVKPHPIKVERALEVWKNVTPVGLYAEAQEAKAGYMAMQSRSVPTVIIQALLKRYNRGLRTGRIDPEQFITKRGAAIDDDED